MRTETFKGKMQSGRGRTFPKPLAFEGTYEAFGTDEKKFDDYTSEDWDAALQEIQEKAPKEYPDNEEIVKYVNNKRLANARQKAMNEAMDAAGISKPTLEDASFRYENMVKILVAAGNDETTARNIAANALNYKPEESAA